jgi:hypothetical protein
MSFSSVSFPEGLLLVVNFKVRRYAVQLASPAVTDAR